MNTRSCRHVLSGVCRIVITLLTACAAAAAPKVRCDADLRPINPPQHPLP
jgi:hypothetical protein